MVQDIETRVAEGIMRFAASRGGLRPQMSSATGRRDFFTRAAGVGFGVLSGAALFNRQSLARTCEEAEPEFPACAIHPNCQSQFGGDGEDDYPCNDHLVTCCTWESLTNAEVCNSAQLFQENTEAPHACEGPTCSEGYMVFYCLNMTASDDCSCGYDIRDCDHC